MKGKKSILLCIILLLFNTSCTNQDIIDENNTNIQKIRDLENQIEQLNLQIESLEEQVSNFQEREKELKKEKDYYLEFIEQLTEPMSQKYLLDIAKEQWRYTAEVDGHPIPEDGIVTIYNDICSLTVTEEQSKYIALPIEIHNQGKIKGNLFSNHIKFLDTKPSDTTGSDDDKRSSATYTFKNLSENNVINLEISEELQERLGLSTNIISIRRVEVDDDEKDEIKTFESDTHDETNSKEIEKGD